MSAKNSKQRERFLARLTGESQASRDLKKLLSLLERSQRPRQEVGLKSRGSGAKKSQVSHPPDSNKHQTDHTIHLALQKFSEEYESERCFSNHPLHRLFRSLLISLVKTRLCCDWIDTADPESVLRVLTCLRILVRDTELQKLFRQHQGITPLARLQESVSESYLSCGGQAYAEQMLVTMTYMFQKMSSSEELRPHITDAGVHRTLVNLLSSTDSSVLLGALMALTSLAHPGCRELIGELYIVETLLVILQEYDLLSKRLSAELLRLLSSVPCVRQQVCAHKGVPVLLSLLHSHHVQLLWALCWVLVQLCDEPQARAEIRSWGGVQQLLHLLSCDRRFVGERSSIETLSSANAAGRLHTTEKPSPHEQQDNIAALQAACCTALTELSVDDSCAHHIVQENGVFIIAKFILPQTFGAKGVVQCYAFRALRFLFSVERNRHLFKRLFPTDLFELFIDVGHYVRDLSAYETLQDKVSLYSCRPDSKCLQEEDLESLRDSIVAVDHNRPPLRVISGYSVLEHLGTGAFGSVFKVRKQSSQTLLALKEVNLHNPAFGKDKRSRESNADKIMSELSIIKEQVSHTDTYRERLYIVMELINGVPLAEYLNSLKEKNQSFTEQRVWNIFIQMCLALRYLHREKNIVHRDLSPNNIMLGEQDWVTITDFGLAKQKQENSKLTSVVGTILYSCPEVVKSEPYGEKADLWALGCVLYQMVTLQPPFYSANMLSLANKIVQAEYEPVQSGRFSDRVLHMIRCSECEVAVGNAGSHPLLLTPSLSPPPSHPLPLTPSLSPPPSHPLPLAPSLSPPPSHPLPLTPSLSPPPSHPLPLTPSLSPLPLAPSLSPLPLTPSLSPPPSRPPPSRPLPLTPSLSPPPSHPLPLTPSLSPPPSRPPPLSPPPSPPSLSPLPLTPSFSPLPLAPSLSPLLLTPSLSPLPLTPPLTPSLSPPPLSPPPLTPSFSPPPSHPLLTHPLPLTPSLSPPPSRPLPLTPSSHPLPLTPLPLAPSLSPPSFSPPPLSPPPSRPLPLTPSFSPPPPPPLAPLPLTPSLAHPPSHPPPLSPSLSPPPSHPSLSPPSLSPPPSHPPPSHSPPSHPLPLTPSLSPPSLRPPPSRPLPSRPLPLTPSLSPLPLAPSLSPPLPSHPLPLTPPPLTPPPSHPLLLSPPPLTPPSHPLPLPSPPSRPSLSPSLTLPLAPSSHPSPHPLPLSPPLSPLPLTPSSHPSLSPLLLTPSLSPPPSHPPLSPPPSHPSLSHPSLSPPPSRPLPLTPSFSPPPSRPPPSRPLPLTPSFSPPPSPPSLSPPPSHPSFSPLPLPPPSPRPLLSPPPSHPSLSPPPSRPLLSPPPSHPSLSPPLPLAPSLSPPPSHPLPLTPSLSPPPSHPPPLIPSLSPPPSHPLPRTPSLSPPPLTPPSHPSLSPPSLSPLPSHPPPSHPSLSPPPSHPSLSPPPSHPLPHPLPLSPPPSHPLLLTPPSHPLPLAPPSHPLPLTPSLSPPPSHPPPSHPLPLTPSLSPPPSRPLPLAPPPSRPLPLAPSLSPPPSHPLPLTPSLSPPPSHPLPSLTPSLSPPPSRPLPLIGC
uniref:non-specific serine/threonine protein kinase n=1 Tax=Knipowitschia caucasica TaxID=637954 RepID=A0AAV2MGK1_KNICA